MTIGCLEEKPLVSLLRQLAAVPGGRFQAHATAALHWQQRRSKGRHVYIAGEGKVAEAIGIGEIAIHSKLGVTQQEQVAERIERLRDFGTLEDQDADRIDAKEMTSSSLGTDDDDIATTAGVPSQPCDDSISDESENSAGTCGDLAIRSFSDCGISSRGRVASAGAAPEVSPSYPPPLLRSSKSRMIALASASEPTICGDGRITPHGGRNTPRDLGGFNDEWPKSVINCLEQHDSVVAKCLRAGPPPTMTAPSQ